MKWFFHEKLNHELAIEEPFFLPTNSQKFSYMERNPFFKQNVLWFIVKNTNVMILEWNKQNDEVYTLSNEIMQFLTTRDFLTHQNCIAASLRRKYNAYTDQKCMAWCENFFILCKIEFVRDESAWKFDR